MALQPLPQQQQQQQQQQLQQPQPSVRMPSPYAYEQPFQTVEDSPMFRSKVHELEENLDSLKERITKLVKGGRKYKDGISTLADSQLSFADYLEEFCGGTDETSMILGGPTLARFVSTFRELGAFSELLRTNVEVTMVESLQQKWLKDLLADAKEKTKRLDKRVADYDSARLRHLGHKSVNTKVRHTLWKKEDPEDSHSEMVAAQAAAEEARFEVARRLTEVEGRKRYEFLEALALTMDAHVKFFARGHEVMKGLEQYLAQAMEVAAAYRDEKDVKSALLDDQVRQFKEESTARQTRLVHVANNPPPKGPRQITADMRGMASEIELLIRQTQQGNGAIVTAIKQGYIMKRSTNMRREWKRRFFVLDSAGMLYYYSNKERIENRKQPQNTVELLTSTIKVDDELRDSGMRFCFRVVSPEKEYVLQAENELEQKEWMEAIQCVIASLLDGNVGAPRPVGTKPKQPTHSRASSLASVDDFGFATNFSADLGSTLSFSGAQRSPDDPHFAGTSGRMEGHHTPDRPPLGGGTMGRTPPPGSITPAPFPGYATGRLGGGGHQAASPNDGPLDILRRVAGNHTCVDCGSPEPDWASLNLGVLLCIECSGIHRRLGVHISKVRSLTLDVRVWDYAVLGMMEGIGNAYANSVWEEAQLAAPHRVDSWVWCDDSDDDEVAAGTARRQAGPQGELAGRVMPADRGGAAAPGGGAGPAPELPKPRSNDGLAVKELYITAKYVERRFVAPGEFWGGSAHSALWDAVQCGNLRGAVRAVVGGADVNKAYSFAPASMLVAETNTMCGKMSGPRLPEGACGDVTILHLACQVGDIPLLEYLLQNNARPERRDAYARTPLHYAVIHAHTNCAKMLMKRSADRNVRDATHHSPLELALSLNVTGDEELLAMLTPDPNA